MMGFVLLTLSFTLAILLSSVIMTVVLFKLTNNAKFVKWFMGYYMKQIDRTVKVFENMDLEDLGSLTGFYFFYS